MDKDDSKVCKTCLEPKPFSEFYLNQKTHSYAAHCKPCYNARCSERQKKSRKDNPEFWKDYDKQRKMNVPSELQNGYRIKSKYGLTPEQHKSLIAKQDGHCAICKKKFDTLCIDHSHETGEVRGLLCGNCNKGIGFLQDNIELLQNAISYLS